MAIWSILLPLGTFYRHLVYFVAILVYFSRFGMLYQEKSGNPDENLHFLKYLTNFIYFEIGFGSNLKT
jgi:hypothetical protein